MSEIMEIRQQVRMNQEKSLRALLNNGEVEMSNNFAEKAISPIMIERKN